MWPNKKGEIESPHHNGTEVKNPDSPRRRLYPLSELYALRAGSRPVSPTGWPPARRGEPTPRREAEPEAGLPGLGYDFAKVFLHNRS